MKTEINPSETSRAKAFEYWMKSPMPMVTVVKTFDVTNLCRVSKHKGMKFNMLLSWCIGKAASKVDEFLTLPEGEKLFRYDHLAINTIFNDLRKSPEGTGISSSLQYNNTRWDSKWLLTSSFLLRPRWLQKRIPSLTREINRLNPPGDIDINGVVDLFDLNKLINMVLDHEHPNMRVADINHDNQLDIFDVNILICMLLEVDEPTQPTAP